MREAIGQIFRYGITGCASLAAYVGLLYLLATVLKQPEMTSNAGAYAVSTVLNYLLHYYWSFKSSQAHSRASWRFLTVVVVGLILNSVFVSVVVSLGMRVEIAAVLFAALWPIASFTSLRLWALR